MRARGWDDRGRDAGDRTARRYGARRLARWLLGLVLVGTGATAAALILLAAFADRLFLGPAADFGLHPMDAGAADWAVRHRGVVVPDEFVFVEGTELRQFVGFDSYWVRYRGPGDFTAAAAAVTGANPGFPPLRTATCADEAVEDAVTHTNLTCAAPMRLACTTAYAGRVVGPETGAFKVPAPTPCGISSDAEVLLLIGDGPRVELVVVSNGH